MGFLGVGLKVKDFTEPSPYLPFSAIFFFCPYLGPGVCPVESAGIPAPSFYRICSTGFSGVFLEKLPDVFLQPQEPTRCVREADIPRLVAVLPWGNLAFMDSNGFGVFAGFCRVSPFYLHSRLKP